MFIRLQVKLESVLNELSKAKEINMLHNEGNKVVFNSAGDQSSSSGERLLADEGQLLKIHLKIMSHLGNRVTV